MSSACQKLHLTELLPMTTDPHLKSRLSRSKSSFVLVQDTHCSCPYHVGIRKGDISDPSVWLIALAIFEDLQVPHLKPGCAIHGDSELQVDWPYSPLNSCSQSFRQCRAHLGQLYSYKLHITITRMP